MRFAWAALLLIASAFNPIKSQNQRKSQLIIELVGSNSTQLEITNLAARALNFTNTTSLQFSVTDINECESNTLNTCSENANCTNTEGSFTCQCHEGYEDSNPTNNPGRTCVDINECDNFTICADYASCNNTPGDYECNCKPGYQYVSGTKSSLLCEDINECETETDNCSPNATCSNGDGDFTCSCNSGYTGDGLSCTEIENPDTERELQSLTTVAITTEVTTENGATTAYSSLANIETTVSSSQTTLETQTTHELQATALTIGTTTTTPEQDDTTELATTTSTAAGTSAQIEDSVPTTTATTTTPTETSPQSNMAGDESTVGTTKRTDEIAMTSSEIPSTVGQTTATTTTTTTQSNIPTERTTTAATEKNGESKSAPEPTQVTTVTESTTATTTASIPTTRQTDVSTSPALNVESSTTTTTTQRPIQTSTAQESTRKPATTTTVATTTAVPTTKIDRTTNNSPSSSVDPASKPSTITQTLDMSTTTTAPLSDATETSAGHGTEQTSTSAASYGVIASSAETEPPTTADGTLLTTTDTATTLTATTTTAKATTTARTTGAPIVTTTQEENLELTTVYVSIVPALVNITEEAVNQFTETLLNESVSLNVRDLEQLTESLTNVLNADDFNVTTETAGKLLNVVDKFQTDFVQDGEPPDGEEPTEAPKIEPEQAAKLTKFVSALLETMVLPVGEEFNQTTETLAIKAVNLPEELAFKAGSSFEVKGEEVILLPGSFLKESTPKEGTETDATGSLQIASSRYADARLFPAEGVDYVNPNRTGKLPPFKGDVIVTAVAGTSIADREVVNSSEKVQIRLPRAVLSDNQEDFDNGTYDRISYVDARCVFFDYSLNNGTGGWSEEGCTIHNADDAANTSCTCNHLTNFAVLMSAKVVTVDPVLNYLSYIGCGLSIFGLLWTIMTYSVFKSLRKHNSKKILLHFCVALCSVYLTYLTGIALKLPSTGTQCLVAGVFMHYFTLCVMAWMFVEVLDMYFMFVKLRHTALHKYMMKVSLIGWIFPCVIALATLGAHLGLEGKDWYVGESRLYPEYVSKDDTICWLAFTGMMYAFAFPTCIILIVNLILFIIVLYNITCKRNSGRLTRIRSTKKKITARQHLINAAALLLLAGPTWIFGYFTNIDPIPDGAIRRTFSYIFVLFNAFQGFWIFVVFSIRPEPVRRLWYELLVKRRIIDTSQTNSRSWQHGTQRNTVSTVATKSPRPSLVPPSTAGSSTKSHLNVNPPEKRVVASRISNTSSNSEQSKSSTRSSTALLVAKQNPGSGTSFRDNQTAPRRLPELRVPSATPPPEDIEEDDEESSCESSGPFGNKERDMTGSPASSRSCVDSEKDLVRT